MIIKDFFSGRFALLKIFLIAAFFAIILFSVRVSFSQVSTNPPECTPPTIGAWIIPQGVTCNFNGDTINVSGSTINPYYHGSAGINIVVYGTLNVANGIINLSDPASAGVINAAKGGILNLNNTQVNFGTSGGNIVQYDNGNPNPPAVPAGTTKIDLSNMTFASLQVYGGIVNVTDSTLTWYAINYGPSQLTMTRVNMPSASLGIGQGTTNIIDSNIASIKTAAQGLNLTQALNIQNLTVSDVLQINGATTANLTNISGYVQLLGDSTTTIKDSPNINKLYFWSNSWLSNYVGYPTVDVSNSKIKNLFTNIGINTQLDIDDLGTADGSYRLYTSKVIQSGNQSRFKLTLTNTEAASYFAYIYHDAVSKISNSNVAIGEINGNPNVTFINSKILSNAGDWSYINGSPNITFVSSTIKDAAIYTWTTPTFIFDKSTVSKMYFLLLGQVTIKGNVAIGPPNDPSIIIFQWGGNGKIIREYPAYIGTAGAAVAIKDQNGATVWSGTAGTDKWAYPQIEFTLNNYNQKYTLDAGGLGSKDVYIYTDTPIELVPQTPPAAGTPCTGQEYACGLFKANLTIQQCIESADGVVKLCIPPNALSQDTYISINPSDASTATIYIKGGWVLQNYYKIEPPGLNFAYPAELTVKYDLAALKQPPSENSLSAWLSKDNTSDSWARLRSSLNTQAQTLTAYLDHLSFVTIAESDATPPVTEAKVDCTYEAAPYSDWCKDNARIILSVTDAPSLNQESGIQNTKYSIDNVNWLDYTAPFSITQKGDVLAYYYSVDKADNTEAVKAVDAKVDKDSDGDTLYDNFDPCPADGRSVNGTGCPFSVKADDDLHVYYHNTKAPGLSYNGYAYISLTGKKFANYKYPLQIGLIGDSRGEEVTTATRKTYSYNQLLTDTSTSSFDAIKPKCQEIYDNTNIKPLGVTEEKNGQEYTGVPAVGQYVVVKRVNIYDGANGLQSTNCKLVKSDSFNIDSNNDGTMDTAKQKLKFMKIVKPTSVQLSPADDTFLTGSLLTITYPAEALWEEGINNYIYPYVFTSDSDWSVDVCLSVPTGYSLVGVYDEAGNFVTAGGNNCSQTFVANESKVLAFEVQKIGSPSKFKVNAKVNAKRRGKIFGKRTTLTTDSELVPKSRVHTPKR